jgi:HAMP domain-containing protein
MEGSVNTLIDDLLWPTREVTRAVAAVAQGDLLQTVQLDVDGRPLGGEFLQSATIVNTMIKQLSVFTSEVTRVAREVGTEGKLGGQAQVPEVTGVWKDLTESVNSMANNLTGQALARFSFAADNLAHAFTIAVANGDLSKKITVDVRGEILQLKEAINTMVDQLRSFASEVTRVAREVGTDGKMGGQAIVPGVAGTWKDLTDSVNAMCGNLTAQVRNIANVTTAVARGDLSRKITVDVRGEILELKDTINTMVDQLNSFASEVTRVAREVGTEGKLGGQAQVPGVAGTWKDLTDNVNFMASNLTAQVRNIADVATAIAGANNAFTPLRSVRSAKNYNSPASSSAVRPSTKKRHNWNDLEIVANCKDTPIRRCGGNQRGNGRDERRPCVAMTGPTRAGDKSTTPRYGVTLLRWGTGFAGRAWIGREGPFPR